MTPAMLGNSDAPADVEIQDLGNTRRVRIRGPVYEFGGYRANGVEFGTKYSSGLVRELARTKGSAWLKDEIDRTERPEYVQIPLARFIRRFCPVTEGLRALDVGCGAAASSIVLGRLGFRVIGIEQDERLAAVGRLRVEESQLASRVEPRWIEPQQNRWPFETESFDVVVMNAVIEHVPLAKRPRLLTEAWRVLRRGGLLFIHDTPNRLWPYDGHTTGLWFVTWLPFRAAAAYARRFSTRIAASISDDELISKGLCAPTYWNVARWLPNGHCLDSAIGNDVTFAFGLTASRPRLFPKRLARTCVIGLLRCGGALVSYFLNAPPAAILQNLDFCFRKH